jgi:hypothetical protein
MTFTANIPNTGQSLGSTQKAVRDNFSNYNNTISVNHVAPNSTGAGKHTFSEFVVQASDPATAPNEITLYGKTTTSGNTELFIRKDNSGNVYQLTSGTPSSASTGYTFLPGGIIIQWGRTNSGSVSFPKEFSNVPYNVQVSSLANGISTSNLVNISNSPNPTSTGFSVNQGTGGLFYYWLAIGPA